jgi:hypothetical protein
VLGGTLRIPSDAETEEHDKQDQTSHKETMLTRIVAKSQNELWYSLRHPHQLRPDTHIELTCQ